MLKGILVGGGGGIQETCFEKKSFTNFITSQELMAARRNGPFQLVCSVCFSKFRPRECFFQMSSVHVHPRAHVCIINEMSKGKFPVWVNKAYKLKKSIVNFFLGGGWGWGQAFPDSARPLFSNFQDFEQPFCLRSTSNNFSENQHFFGNFWAILNQNAE